MISHPFSPYQGQAVKFKPTTSRDYVEFPEGYKSDTVRVVNTGDFYFKIAFTRQRRDATENDITILPKSEVILLKDPDATWINHWCEDGDTLAYAELGTGGL